MSDKTDNKLQLNNTHYKAKRYMPDSGFEASGILALILGLSATGALLGAGAEFVGQWFYLILLFPAGIGFAQGFMGSYIVKRTKMRNPVIGIAAGFLGGVFAMAAMHYSSYYKYQNEITKFKKENKEIVYFIDNKEKTEPSLDATQRAELNNIEKAIKASESFVSFLEFKIDQGVSIKRISRGKGIKLTGIGAIIYYVLEIFIVAGISLYFVFDQARWPFCVGSGTWKEVEVCGYLTGEKDKVIDSIETGNVGGLLNFITSLENSDFMLKLYSCPKRRSSASIELELLQIKINKKNEVKTKKVSMMTYPGDAMVDIKKLFSKSGLEDD